MGKEFWLGKPPGESRYDVGAGGADLERLMMQRAQGMGPSAAELMMNRGMQQQIAAGRSMAAGARGVSPGLAMRQAGQREAGAMSNVGQQAGIMRAQEQAQAQQMMAAYLQAQDRMRLEQDMYNAARQQRQGMLGPMLGMGGQIGAAALGMPWGGGGGGGGTPVTPGPSWGERGITGPGWGGGMGGGLGWGGGGPMGFGYDIGQDYGIRGA